MERSDHVEKNKRAWDAISSRYLPENVTASPRGEVMTWGLWHIPESELHILGDVQGKDVLDLGCGTGRWSIALAQCGARPVGLDVSSHQLEHARHCMTEGGFTFPLIEASAEDIPLPAASFDIVI